MLWETKPRFCKIYMWCLLPKTPCVSYSRNTMKNENTESHSSLFLCWFDRLVWSYLLEKWLLCRSSISFSHFHREKFPPDRYSCKTTYDPLKFEVILIESWVFSPSEYHFRAANLPPQSWPNFGLHGDSIVVWQMASRCTSHLAPAFVH
jgi:hypothetical protein